MGVFIERARVPAKPDGTVAQTGTMATPDSAEPEVGRAGNQTLARALGARGINSGSAEPDSKSGRICYTVLQPGETASRWPTAPTPSTAPFRSFAALPA